MLRSAWGQPSRLLGYRTAIRRWKNLCSRILLHYLSGSSLQREWDHGFAQVLWEVRHSQGSEAILLYSVAAASPRSMMYLSQSPMTWSDRSRTNLDLNPVRNNSSKSGPMQLAIHDGGVCEIVEGWAQDLSSSSGRTEFRLWARLFSQQMQSQWPSLLMPYPGNYTKHRLGHSQRRWNDCGMRAER